MQSIKEEAELVKADLTMQELLDTTGSVQNDRQGIVNELEKHFKNSYSVGNTVILDNGYEVFVTEKEEIIVRKYDESDVATIVASHTTQKWQEKVNSAAWESSNLNTADTEIAGIPIPVGFSLSEGTIDAGIVIINDDTNDEFVWIPVDNTAKATVTFKSKNDLKTVTGPTGAIVKVNGRTATVEFTTGESGIYEFYAEDKDGNKKYYDVEIGGINLSEEYFSNQGWQMIYRPNATETQKERALYKFAMGDYTYSWEVTNEKELIKKWDPSQWYTIEDIVTAYEWYDYTSLEDWYNNNADNLIANVTEEQMKEEFISYVNDDKGTSLTTEEELVSYFKQLAIDDNITTMSSTADWLEWECGEDYNTIDKWYEGYNFYETIPTELQTSVAKYGGFYVGRYEAGSSSIRTSSNKDTASNPIMQKNQYPYNYVTQITAVTACTNYSGKENTTSHLLYGGEWDAVLQYIVDKNALGNDTYNKVTKDSTEWGNYYNATFEFTGRYSTNSGSSFSNGSMTKPEKKSYLLGTGVSERNKVLNIYDIAGNLWEWTQEERDGGAYRAYRGGCFHYYGSICPASCRYYGNPSHYGSVIGFRVGLYL